MTDVFSSSTEIDSPRWTVWSVLTDLSYVPKLFSNAITVEVVPPGPPSVGHKCTILGKIGSVQVVIPTQYTTVEREVRLVSKVLPGGVFSTFTQAFDLVAMGLKTKVNATFEYEVAPESLGKVADAETMDAVIQEDLAGYLPRLKEICELIPLPR